MIWLHNLFKMNDVRSLILATVIDVNGGPITYPSCSFCHTKVHEGNSSSSGERRFVCSKCRKTIPNCEVNHRFRVSLRIAEGCTECDVTIFGSCLDKVLGAAAEKFVQYQYNLQQNGFSSNQIQDLICQVFSNSLIGQKYYFGFRIPKTAKGRTLEYVIETAPSCGIVAHQIVTIDDPIRSVYADFKSEAEKAWRRCQTRLIQNDPDEDLDLTVSQSILDNRSAFDFSPMSSVNYSNQQLSLGLASFETSLLSQGVTPRSVARKSNMSCNSSVYMRKKSTGGASVTLNVETPVHFIPAITLNSVEKANKSKSCTSKCYSEDPSESLYSKDSQFCCRSELNENDGSKSDVPKNCDNFSETLFTKDSQIPLATDVSKSVGSRQSTNFLLPPVNWKYKSKIPVRDTLSESLFSKDSQASCIGSNISKSSYALHRQSSSVGRVGSRGRVPRNSGRLCVSRASTMADIPSEIFSETLFSVDSQASKANLVVETRIQSAEVSTCALNSDSVTNSTRSKPQIENFSESLFSQESQFDSFLGFADADANQKERSSRVATHVRLSSSEVPMPVMNRCSGHLFSEEILVLGVANASKGCYIAVEDGINNNCIQNDCVATPLSKACNRNITNVEEAKILEPVEFNFNDTLFSEEIPLLGCADASTSKCCDIAKTVRMDNKFQDNQMECAATGNDSLFSEEIPVVGDATSSCDGCDDAVVKGGSKGNCSQKDCAVTSKSDESGTCAANSEKTKSHELAVADECTDNLFSEEIPVLDDLDCENRGLGAGFEKPEVSGAVPLEETTGNLKSMADECNDDIFSEEIQFSGDLDCETKSSGFSANFKKPEVPTSALSLPKSAIVVNLKDKTKSKDLNPETFCMWDLLADCSDFVVMPEDNDDIAQYRRNKISESRTLQEFYPPDSERLDEFLGKCDESESSIRVKGNNSIVLGVENLQRSAPVCGVGKNANLNKCAEGGVCEAPPPESGNIDEFLRKCDDVMSDSEICSSSFEDSKLLREVFALEVDMVGGGIPKNIVEITSDCSPRCKKDLATFTSLEKVIESEKSCTSDSVLDYSCDLFTPTPKSLHMPGSQSQEKDAGKCDIYQEIGRSHESIQADSGLGHSASQLQDKCDGVPPEPRTGFIGVPEKGSFSPVTDDSIHTDIATKNSRHFGRYLEPKKLMIQFVEASQDLWSQDLFSSPTQTLKSPSVKLGSNAGQKIEDRKGRKMPGRHFQNTDVPIPVAYTHKIAAPSPNSKITCRLTDSETPGIVFKTPCSNIRTCSFRKSKPVLNQTSTPLSFRNISSDLKISCQDQRKSAATGIVSVHCENRTLPNSVLNSTENSLLKRPKSSLKNLRTPSFPSQTTRCKVLKTSDKSNTSVFDSPTIQSLRKTVRFAEKFLRCEDKENLSCLSDSVLLLAAGEDGDVGGSVSESCCPVGEENLVETRTKYDTPRKVQTPNCKTNGFMYQSHSPDLFSSMDDSMFEAIEPLARERSPFRLRGDSSKSRNGRSQKRASLVGDKSLPALSFDVSGDLFSD